MTGGPGHGSAVVLGLTGPNAAGKGEVAAHLARRGFVLHSLSDIVREEAARRGLPPERAHLIRIGIELRRDGGPGVLAGRIVGRLGRRDVVDSIRHPAEVAILREVSGFVLLGVRAALEVRFARSLSRGRPGDPATVEEFRAREAQENSRDPDGQQLEATFALADLVVDNDGDLQALHGALDRALGRIGAS